LLNKLLALANIRSQQLQGVVIALQSDSYVVRLVSGRSIIVSAPLPLQTGDKVVVMSSSGGHVALPLPRSASSRSMTIR